MTVARLEAEYSDARERERKRYEELFEKYSLLRARAHATEGADGADFTSREDFAALEAEYRAFEKFFSAEWKKTKAHIRKTKLSRIGKSTNENEEK